MSYRRIVIGVDFATASLAAVRWVASTFDRRARLLLVHVTSAPRRSAFLKHHLPAIDVLNAAPTVYQGLRSLANLSGRNRSDVDILSGNPAEGLALAAEEFGADLICVGKSRRRRGSGRFGATTPQRVLSRTPLPVLVVSDNARAQLVSVLAAVNDDSEGAHVLQTASRLALGWNARLDALHVIEPELRAIAQEAVHGANMRITASRTAAHLGAATMNALNDARLCLLAREWLAEQVAGLKMRKERVIPIARLGDAGEETIGHAVRSETGLIVLGRGNQRSSAGVAALGSTTRQTMWVAPCPVLVLPAKSASPRYHTSSGRWSSGISRQEAPALTAVTGMSTNALASSSRSGSDGGDAA
jgi:nucleotide-binding universal stress UspA family protein